MWSELVPIRVRVTLGVSPKGTGELAYVYPPFDEIPKPLREDLRAAALITKYGGWLPDNCSDFGEIDEYNDDQDVRYFVCTVPEGFARAACEKWPDLCEPMTEAELEDFHDNRCAINQADTIADEKAVAAVRARRELGGDGALSALDKQSMDPAHRRAGVTENWRATWKRRAAKRGIRIKSIK